MECWKNVISVVHHHFYLKRDLLPKLNFPFQTWFLSILGYAWIPFQQHVGSDLNFCVIVLIPVGSVSREKLPSTAWHPFVPHFHSPAVTISVASPHTFFIQFHLLNIFINNFWGLFGVFFFSLLTWFSWFFMPCLSPDSHFISPVSERLPCLGQARPSFYDSQDTFKTTLVSVRSSCS